MKSAEGTAGCLITLLQSRADRMGDAPFATFGPEQLTASMALDRARRTASGLSARGIGRGDVVAIMASYRAPVLDQLFALSSLGAICAPLNVHLRGEALAF